MNAVTKIEPPNIIGALAKALPELDGAKKTKANPAFKSKYADLASVLDAITPIAAHGLWFRQVSHNRDDGACIETFYIHESGAELSAGTVFMPASKKDAQGFGSAETYARRYGLIAAFGLATEDDDGNAAVKSSPANQKQEVAAPAEMPASEWSRLVQLIEATKSDTNAMLKHFGVANLKHLNQTQYAAALAMLNTKLAKQTKAETNSLAEALDDEINF